MPSRQTGPLREKRIWGRSTSMLDIILLALGLVFFVLSIGYAYACDQL
jgi:hypothetical protein